MLKVNLFFKNLSITVFILFFTLSAFSSDLEIYVSHKRGFYDNTFQLYIETNDPNATIRYTTNRYKPTTSYGTIYNGPININTTKIVRIFAYNGIEEDDETHTYIFPNNIIAQSYMQSYIKNNGTYGPQLYDALKSLPVVSLVSPNNTIDDITEIEGSFEIFTNDGTLSKQENCGAKLYGYSSVDNSRKKNHRIYFRDIYGAKNLEAKLFEGFENGIGAVTKFDQIELRGISQEGFSDSNFQSYTYVGPNFLDQTMLQMGNLHSHSRFVHFYVNGQYRGQYAMRERMNDDFMESYYGGAETDYEAIDGAGGGNLGGNWTPGTAFDGTGAMYNAMVAQSNNYDNWKNYLNTDSYFDFMLSFMWGNHENEMKAVGNLTDPTKFIYRINDGDGAFTYYDGHLGAVIDRTNPNASGSHNVAGHDNVFRNLYNQGDSDFFIDFADRVECHCFNDGPLTPNQTQQRIDGLVNEMQLSIIADAARWGYSNQGHYPYLWSDQINQVKQNFLPSRTNTLINQLKNRNFYPTTDAVSFNQYGGVVGSNFQLVLSNPGSGKIYYTIDGTDPRNDGGSIKSNAQLYSGPITLPNGVYTVKARVYRSNATDRWSAMCPRKFYVNQNYSDLIINEIHYNPKDSIFYNSVIGANDTISGREFEFIELKNNGQNTIFLADVSFIKGITLNFDDSYSIPPGGFLVFAESEIRFTEKYGFTPDGQYQGKLDNGGENLWIVDPFENVIDTLKYNDVVPWDPTPDLGEYSLALIDANLDNAQAASWGIQSVFVTPRSENLFCNTISANPSVADVSCNSSNDGFIFANPSGGTSPYTYQWSNGNTSSVVTNLAAGNYSVTIFDNFLCEETFNFTITEPSAIQMSTNHTNETYFQANDGTASVNVSGGIPPYTYSWSNGANTSSVSNLAPGNYSVDVYDSYSCPISANFAIQAIDCSAFSLNVSKTNETYYQTNNGTTTAIALGKTPYTYDWSNGASTQNINNLVPNIYSVTVTDAVGCNDTKSVTIQAIDCSAFSLSTSKTNETYFQTNDGTASATVLGTAPYTYDWSNGASTQNINNLTPNTYSVTVTDAVGCGDTKPVTIQAIDCSAFALNVSKTNETYFQAGDGTAAVSVTSGSSPYSYDWSNGTTTQNVNNLAANTYSVTVTDAVGCSDIAYATIQNIDCSTFSLNVSKTDESYYQTDDGTAIATVIGTTPYSYDWSNGATTQNVNNLAPNTYSVTVTDAVGCSDTKSVTIQAIDCAAFSINTSKTDETYYQANDGTASVTALGNGPHTYYWSNNLSTQNINNLTPNTYSVTVTDAVGCSDTKSVTVQAIDCSAYSLSTSKTNETYYQTNDGTASATAIGTAPYAYDWSNNASTQNINNLAPNTYSVTVTDAVGCSDTKSVNIQAINCATFSVNVSKTNETYYQTNDGTASATALGTAPYTYDWSNNASTQNINNLAPNTYSVTVTDAVGCSDIKSITIQAIDCAAFSLSATKTDETYYQTNDGTATATALGTMPYSYDWSNGASTQNINNLAPNTYAIIVTDAVGCNDAKSVTIKAIDCAAFSLSTTKTDETYYQTNDGTATATALGIAPYTYDWSNGASTQNINNLAPNTYAATVTDVVGCSDTKSVIIQAIDCSSFSVNVSKTNETYFQAGDGTAAVNVISGLAPYSYNWSNGASTQNINNLVPNTYSVTVTDALGCSNTDFVSIQNIDCSSFSVNVSKTDETYYQTNDGTAGVTALGTAPYTYDWSNGASTQNINNLAPTTYSVTVTDDVGCSDTKSTTIEAIDCAAFALSVSKTDETYYQTNNGTASVTILGTAPYTYDWSNGPSTQNISNLTPNTYSVTVTDAIGCSDTKSITIQAIDCTNFSVNISKTDETYYQANDGNATATVLGTAPYTYDWSNGASTQNINNLAPNTYTITVTDAVGCSDTKSTIVQAIDCAGFSLNTFKTDETYFQTNDGMATATAIGTAPYTYSWSNGASTQNINNLVPNTYTISVTDAVGCSDTKSVTIEAIDCTAFSLSATKTDETYFQTNDGTANATALGTAPYSYDWSNGASTQNINNLAPSTYSVIVTDALGCSDTKTVIVEEIDCAAFSLSATKTDETYFQSNDGTANATALGTAPYSYDWSNSASTQNINNLAPGTYSIMVTDALGCNDTKSVTVQAIDCSAFSLSVAKTNETFFQAGNGTATASVATGTTPYAYLWSNSATTASINNLAPGQYSVNVIDAVGCSNTAFATIQDIDCANFSIAANHTNETYFQNNDGTVSVTALGTAPYSYDWSNGASTQNINDLAPNTYSVTVTDAVGCSDTKSVTVQAIDCAAFSLNISKTDESYYQADDGTATATALGTAPYSYDWSNNASTQNINNLVPNTYTVTATDALGCNDTKTVTIEAIDCSAFFLNVSKTNETNYQANDGTASVAALGTAPYSYDWSNGASTQNINDLAPATYSVIITDAVGCSDNSSVVIQSIDCAGFSLTAAKTDETYFQTNDGTASATVLGTAPYVYDWTNGASTQNINNLAPGTYSVTVTDAVGCSDTKTVNIQAIDCAGFSLTAAKTDETYYQTNDGTATATALGTAPYAYDWSNGASTQNINNLAPNTYSVIVTDALGCNDTKSVAVEAIDCAGFSLTAAKTDETYYQSNNGTASATALGIAPYTYDWSNGASTQNINNLAPTTYSVIVTDAIGCSDTEPVTVDAIDCSAFSLTVSKTNETYFQAGDGTAAVSVVSGVAPYAYLWSDGATTASINNLAPNTYSVTVTDALGCSNTDYATIQNIDCANFSVTANKTDETYFQANNGTATATALGTAPYTYDWSNGATTQNISNLAANDYSVTVRDAVGCSDTKSVTIEAIDCAGFSLTASKTDETYFQTNDGTASAVALGTAPYVYAWSNGASTQNINNLAPGIYVVAVVDAVGCTDVQPVSVQAVNCSGFSLIATKTDESYYQANDGEVSATVLGTAPYSYDWSNGATTASINNLAPNTYSVTVTDAVGCSDTKSANIEAIDCTSFALTANKTDESYYQTNNGTASAAALGTAPYTYDWSNGATTQTINNLAPNTYSVSVTDAVGCSDDASVSIAAISCSPLAVSVNAVDESCGGSGDGLLVINSVQNGTAPYSYLWSTGITGTVANNLISGSYSLNVTDSKGCSFNDTYNVAPSSAITATSNITSTTSANASDGSIEITVNGGVGPYSFNWSNGAISQNIYGLATGNYSLTIKDSNNCQAMFNNLQIGNDCTPIIIQNTKPNVASGIYQVEDFIQSDGVINNDKNVSFKAGQYIELKSNFEVEIGAEFEAIIDGCE